MEETEYKGSPFLNIGPHIQKEYHDKPIDPEYDGPHPSHQTQINPLINNGKVKNAKEHYENRYDCPFITNEGYQIVIKDYIDKHHVVVEFLCSGWQTTARLDDIKKGCVKYPYHPNKNMGYFGEGPYTKNSHRKMYNTWTKMLERVQGYGNNIRNKSYINVSVCYEWYNYQTFAFWMDNYLKNLNPNLYDDYQIDKDLYQMNQEYKIYSPNTCCMVPSAINYAISSLDRERVVENLPIGVHKNSYNDKYVVNISLGNQNSRPYLGEFNTPQEAFMTYKATKEKYIRELADYYYSINAIYKEVRDLLYAVNIEP